MIAPEAMNSSPVMSAVIDPQRPVSSQDLQTVVERAQDQLRQLAQQRQEIAQRIAIIKRTIRALALLCDGRLQRRPDHRGNHQA